MGIAGLVLPWCADNCGSMLFQAVLKGNYWKMKFVLGLIVGLLILPIAVFIYFRAGHPPVAVADTPLLLEKQVVKVPLKVRIDKEMPKSAPLEPSDMNLQAGAHIYREQCAACHGLYGRPSSFAKEMYPVAPQLWAPHGNGVVGVSDDPPGETYWKIENGIRLTGMPAFGKILNQTQMWQVTLLLAHANQPPAAALEILKQPLELDSMASSALQPSPSGQ